ncbi:MAG TPA: hypothetical protein PKE00_12145, partial [Planctomycetota bacterium]|nr:hypothetical protein [Planctomycetota bacterium]
MTPSSLRFCLPALLIAASLTAQGIEFATPRGIEFFEGNSSSNIMLGNYAADTRVQQVDNSLVGVALPAIRFLAWRRDGAGAGTANKVVTLEIVMAHSDYA